jgi:hypothetical protein
MVAGWSTTTSTGPCLASRSNIARSLGSVLGSGAPMPPLAGGAQADGVVLALADVQPEEKRCSCWSPAVSFVSSRLATSRASTAGSHGTTRPTRRWPCPYQRSLDVTKPGATTPRIMGTTGGLSHAGPGDQNSLIRSYKEGNGGDDHRYHAAPPRATPRHLSRRRPASDCGTSS